MKQGAVILGGTATTGVVHRSAAERVLAYWHEGLRLNKPSGLPQSEDDLVKDVIKGRPQSATQLVRATVAVTNRMPMKKVRRFAQGLGSLLLDLNASERPSVSINSAHEWETEAEGIANMRQLRVANARESLTVADLDSAIHATETQITTLNNYADVLRAERSAMLARTAS
ncbi:MAG: hypothetical protein ACO1Q7_02040 [Gemmatimonas sp.]